MTDPRITDEAVDAAERAYIERWRDRVPAPGAGMRAALEAALPHLAPKPTREQVEEAVAAVWLDPQVSYGLVVDAVLALINGSAK